MFVVFKITKQRTPKHNFNQSLDAEDFNSVNSPSVLNNSKQLVTQGNQCFKINLNRYSQNMSMLK